MSDFFLTDFDIIVPHLEVSRNPSPMHVILPNTILSLFWGTSLSANDMKLLETR